MDSIDFSTERQAILASIVTAGLRPTDEDWEDLISGIEEVFESVSISRTRSAYRLKGHAARYDSIDEVDLFFRDFWDERDGRLDEVYFDEKPSDYESRNKLFQRDGSSFQDEIQEEWFLVITRAFSKSIKNVDRKIQNRIQSAIDEIASDPISPKGNTIRPLANDRKGLWRYRIGSYRLIYAPIERDRKVLLLKFSSRGQAYAV